MLSVMLRFLVLAVVLMVMVDAAPAKKFKKPVLNDSKALDYLEKYGYLGQVTKTKSGIQDKKSAIFAFQKMAGLKSTGLLNNETLKMMGLPRCGVSDTKKRPGLNDFRALSRWPKKDLKYTITKYPATRLSRQQVDQEIARAFQVWADHTDLTFRVVDPRLDRRPDIDIKFEVGNHGDGSSFDGSGGTLAHAFFPTEGRAHFDDSEEWTVYTNEGINLFQVAAHEFGHSLGIDHSEIRSALMAPFYQGYQPRFRLDNDDIQAIQQLYGRKTTQAAPPSPSLPPQPQPPTFPGTPNIPSWPRPDPFDGSLCQDLTFDTIFTDLQKVTYVIKGRQYWELGSTGVMTSPPRNVQTKWAGLPDRVDAAFSHKEIGKTYFFAGSYFWRYQDERLDAGYPKLISDGFPGIPDNVDAAVVWPRNNQIYFFKGSFFWKFDYTALPQVASDYPRQIGAWWRGVPDAPDAAFSRADGRTYFVKGGSFAGINDQTISLDSWGYRGTGVLFGCPNANKQANSTREIAWMASSKVRLPAKTAQLRVQPSPRTSETLRKPNHKKCIKKRTCRKFP